MPLIMLVGGLTVGTASFPGIGQQDLSTPVVLFNGAAPGILASFFRTSTGGLWIGSFSPVPSLSGLVLGFQTLTFTGDSDVVAFSNAVEVDFL